MEETTPVCLRILENDYYTVLTQKSIVERPRKGIFGARDYLGCRAVRI